MAEFVKMPKMGSTMKEGKLVKWLVAEGDTVEEGDELFSVETDKLSNNIESYEDGVVLKILIAEGETVPCQTPLAIIGEKDEDISDMI